MIQKGADSGGRAGEGASGDFVYASVFLRLPRLLKRSVDFQWGGGGGPGPCVAGSPERAVRRRAVALSTEGSLCVCAEVRWLPALQPTGGCPPTKERGGTALSRAHRPCQAPHTPSRYIRPSLLRRHSPRAGPRANFLLQVSSRFIFAFFHFTDYLRSLSVYSGQLA